MIFLNTVARGLRHRTGAVERRARRFHAAWCQREFDAMPRRPVSASHSTARRDAPRAALSGRAVRETKIVRCSRAIFDVIVSGPTLQRRRHFSIILSSSNRMMLFVPEGSRRISDAGGRDGNRVSDVEFYQPDHARGVRWNDPHSVSAGPTRPIAS
jgi:dTDP-4-dehydrorhamnose 3,5-epimerase-like enzyme